jgi:hypothetical protein
MNRNPPPPINPNFNPSAPSVVPRSPAPTNAELKRFGIYLGVNISKRPDMVEIVREAIQTPLPPNWKEYETDQKEIYYYNSKLDFSTWEHPVDAFYRNLIKNRLEVKPESRCCVIL